MGNLRAWTESNRQLPASKTGGSKSPPDLTPAEHDRLHWLAGEVVAGRMPLADAESLARRLVRL